MEDKILFSIITPCYNHGQYLDEMIESIHSYKWHFQFEHIIINDGSTDLITIKKLEEITYQERIKVINQQNKGLAAARNAGLTIAKGKYILPIDSDNTINAAIFTEALQIMEQNNDIDVIYTDVYKFGEKNEIWKVGKLDRQKMFLTNQIDACTLIRRKTLDTIGVYDENMPIMGMEDWELWLRFIINNKTFYYLEKIGFNYRVNSSSMTFHENMPKFDQIRSYVISKHALAFHNFYKDLFEEMYHYKYTLPILSILKTLLLRVRNKFSTYLNNLVK